MFCPRCGKEMQETDRNCFSCGALNPMHPANSAFMQENSNVSGNNMQSRTEVIDISKEIESEYEPRYNKAAFAIVNIISYLFSVFIIYIFIMRGLDMESSGTSILSIGISFFIAAWIYVYFLSFEKLLAKASLPWWGLFIPIYNVYLFYKLAFGNAKPLILLIIFGIIISIITGVAMYARVSGNLELYLSSYKFVKLLGGLYGIVSTIIEIAHSYCLGKSFGSSGILMVFFGYIMLPLIAFSDKYQYERL